VVCPLAEEDAIPLVAPQSAGRGGSLPELCSFKILSMHGSKGLEFPVVFLPCLDSMPAPSQEVAAEAKLLYVAMTRAMERLHMTHHAGSVFVDRLRAALGAGTAAPSRNART
jgi:superfamily I DNA/RNA helicase